MNTYLNFNFSLIILIPFFCLNFYSSFSQKQGFNFGIQTGINLSQIEGDNLRGFNKVGYNIGWLGGYSFNATNEIIVSGLYERLGSDRSGTRTSRFGNRPLAEVNLQLASIFLAFSQKIGDSWDGSQKFRYVVGLKYNNILSEKSQLFYGDIDDNLQLTKEDFKKHYISMKLGLGILIHKKTALDLYYEHALQNIIYSENATPLNKLVPFSLGLSISYYI